MHGASCLEGNAHLEELDVIVVADGGLVFGPNGVDSVDAGAVEVDGEVDEITVLKQHTLHFIRLSEVLAVLPQHHAHASARRSVSSLLYGVRAAAVAAPQVPRAGVTASRRNAHTVTRHKHAVKANAKLADEGGGVGVA